MNMHLRSEQGLENFSFFRHNFEVAQALQTTEPLHSCDDDYAGGRRMCNVTHC